jgi:hypothetical protein
MPCMVWWMGLAPEISRLKKGSKLLEPCKINPAMRFSVKFWFSREQLVFFDIFNSSWSQPAQAHTMATHDYHTL